VRRIAAEYASLMGEQPRPPAAEGARDRRQSPGRPRARPRTGHDGDPVQPRPS